MYKRIVVFKAEKYSSINKELKDKNTHTQGKVAWILPFLPYECLNQYLLSPILNRCPNPEISMQFETWNQKIKRLNNLLSGN